MPISACSGRAVGAANFVTRASKVNTHYTRGQFSGISAITKAITLNVYEKVIELEQSGDMERLS